MLIEKKDTSSGKRLMLSDSQFRGYLVQLLYYLVLAQKEKKGHLVINYSMRDQIWDHKDADGRSWFYRPANPKKPGLKCWCVFMATDDPVRNMLWLQMKRRNKLFLR